ncbi:MAG: zinc-ribbon domain-containing protein [Proteobacteria bacterium]|nr:zinc-ribbon domain-containing protein [Pseudomonadota bacterium]
MYCPDCGYQLPEGASFCPKCGSSNIGHVNESGSYPKRWFGMEDLASRWARLGAALIDVIIMMAISVPVGVVVGVIDFSDMEASQSIGNQVLSSLISVALYLAINGYFLAKNGQTVGKLALSIKIVRTNREKASFGRLIGLRYVPVWIVTSIPLVGGLVGLLDILLVFREEKNCLHDDIADTRVVKA